MRRRTRTGHDGYFSLPREMRLELAQRLRDSGFSRYAEHAQWVAGKGGKISKSALHRLGQGLQKLWAIDPKRDPDDVVFVRLVEISHG